MRLGYRCCASLERCGSRVSSQPGRICQAVYVFRGRLGIDRSGGILGVGQASSFRFGRGLSAGQAGGLRFGRGLSVSGILGCAGSVRYQRRCSGAGPAGSRGQS